MSTLAYLSYNDYILQNGIFGKISAKVIKDYNTLVVGNNQSTVEDAKSSEEKFQDAIDRGDFIPPWEYKEQDATAENKNDRGYLKLNKKSTGSGETQSYRIQSDNYFWVDDFKNWCTYTYAFNNPALDNMPVYWKVNVVKRNFNSTNPETYYEIVYADLNIFRDDNGNYLADHFLYTDEEKERIVKNVILKGGKVTEAQYNLFNYHYNDIVNVPYDWTYNEEFKSENTSMDQISYIGGTPTPIVYQKTVSPEMCSKAQMAERRNLTTALELANSGTYSGIFTKHYQYGYNSKVGYSAFQLYVWNGRDGFVPVQNMFINSAEEIAVRQNYFFYNLMNNNQTVIQTRGTYFNDAKKVFMPSDTGDYSVANYKINFKLKDYTEYHNKPIQTIQYGNTTATYVNWDALRQTKTCYNYKYGSPSSSWNDTMTAYTNRLSGIDVTNPQELHEKNYIRTLNYSQQPNWYWENNTVLKNNETKFSVFNNTVSPLNYLDYSPLQIIQGFILQNQRSYTIVDKETFQCVRPGSPYFFNEKLWQFRNHTSNEPGTRAGLATGNPAMYRLATGEICLCTSLWWGGLSDVCGIKKPDFLNDFCKKFFGEGRDRTIAKDWLHLTTDINTTEETATNASTILTAYDSTLAPQCIDMPNRIDADEGLNLSFNVQDVNVSVEQTEEHEDYVSKW